MSDTSNQNEPQHKIAELEAKLNHPALKDLRDAVDFYDRCVAAGEEAYSTGAMKDAHEWVFKASRCVAEEVHHV